MSAALPELPELPDKAFTKADQSPDALFYQQPRFVAHIDDGAIAAVTQLYREVLPPSGVLLDLMGSWISHLPDDIAYAEVIGHGMNAEELAANPRYNRHFVQNLNQSPVLPLGDASVDAVTMCVSVQYLQRPRSVMQEVRRVLRPGGPAVITFSNRCFPTKAVAIWRALSGPDQCRLVELYLRRSGFEHTEARELASAGDPVWAVIGRA